MTEPLQIALVAIFFFVGYVVLIATKWESSESIAKNKLRKIRGDILATAEKDKNSRKDFEIACEIVEHNILKVEFFGSTPLMLTGVFVYLFAKHHIEAQKPIISSQGLTPAMKVLCDQAENVPYDYIKNRMWRLVLPIAIIFLILIVPLGLIFSRQEKLKRFIYETWRGYFENDLIKKLG